MFCLLSIIKKEQKFISGLGKTFIRSPILWQALSIIPLAPHEVQAAINYLYKFKPTTSQDNVTSHVVLNK